MWIELTFNENGWLPGAKVTINTDRVSHIAPHPAGTYIVMAGSAMNDAMPVMVQETYAQVQSLLGTITHPA